MGAEAMDRVGPPAGDQQPDRGPTAQQRPGVDEDLFRRPEDRRPLDEAPPSRPGEATVAHPRPWPGAAPPSRGVGRLVVAGLVVLGMIGSGIVGSLTTLVLAGRTAPVAQPAAPPQSLAAVDRAQAPVRPGESLAAVVRKVLPAVVTIRTREGPRPQAQTEGEGSGFIVDTEGHIVTNNHVIADANRITLILADGTRVAAKLVGADPNTDLAVLKADLPAGKWAVAALGDSDTVQPGDPAIAIGSPFGLDHSVTSGIISAVNRDWGRATGRLRGLLQTDAPVNPGNSGGPLLNAAGEVIGVTNAIEGPVRGSVGVGFAIPINTVKRLLPQLSTGKKVEHPWLGISGVGISSDLAEELRLPVAEGVLVVEVIASSPAAKAGVLGGRAGQPGERPTGGDIITKVDGRAVKTVQEIASYLDTKGAGATVTLTILREGGTQELPVILGVWPDNLRS